MSMPVRIDGVLKHAKADAAAKQRSMARQIASWAKIGRAALDKPD